MKITKISLADATCRRRAGDPLYFRNSETPTWQLIEGAFVATIEMMNGLEFGGPYVCQSGSTNVKVMDSDNAIDHIRHNDGTIVRWIVLPVSKQWNTDRIKVNYTEIDE